MIYRSTKHKVEFCSVCCSILLLCWNYFLVLLFGITKTNYDNALAIISIYLIEMLVHTIDLFKGNKALYQLLMFLTDIES